MTGHSVERLHDAAVTNIPVLAHPTLHPTILQRLAKEFSMRQVDLGSPLPAIEGANVREGGWGDGKAAYEVSNEPSSPIAPGARTPALSEL